MNSNKRFVSIVEITKEGGKVCKIKDTLKLMPTMYFLDELDMNDIYYKLISNQIKIGSEEEINKAKFFNENYEQEIRRMKKDLIYLIEEFFNKKQNN